MTETDLEAAIDSMVASRESRREDWDTLAFQTKAGPEYRRAQIRYVGSGGTGHQSTGSTPSRSNTPRARSWRGAAASSPCPKSRCSLR